MTTSAGGGRYLFVESRNWYLNTTVAAGVARSRIVSVHRRQWKAADGSGWIISRWDDPFDRPREDDEEFGPGELHVDWWPGTLSGDPAELRHQLTAGQPDPAPVRVLTAIKDLYDEQPVAPAIAAAVLRIVADLPGLHQDGTTVSLESADGGSASRHVLTFDANTDLLTCYEEVLTRSAGHLAASVPCVLSRRIYVRAAQTDVSGPA